MNVLVVVPARMKATRFPGKPLLSLCGAPMVIHVWRRGVEAKIGDVIVATEDQDVVDVVRKYGGEAVLTKECPTGTDRVALAAQEVDPTGQKYDLIVNLQGDLPTADAKTIQTVLKPFQQNLPAEVGTVAVPSYLLKEEHNPHSVKAVMGLNPNEDVGRVLYFTRGQAPYGDGPLYHHLGLYAFRRPTLDWFLKAPQGILEQRESLEQIRFLENGRSIFASLVEGFPLEINVPEDVAPVEAELRRMGNI